MLIGPFVTIAFKCPACGIIKYDVLNVFQKNKYIECDCKESGVKISYYRKKYNIILKCFACNDNHTFKISTKDFWSNNINKFICPKMKMEVCYLGKDDNVRDAIDNYEHSLDSILDELDDYENYFENNVVMLNVVNIIHDMAEKGNLACKCGSKEIVLNLVKDKVFLQCSKCNNFQYICASSNRDLKEIEERKMVILSDKINEKIQLYNR